MTNDYPGLRPKPKRPLVRRAKGGRKYKYTFLGYFSNLPGFRSKGGGYNSLRRDDGKRVNVTQKRLNQLTDEGRVTFPELMDLRTYTATVNRLAQIRCDEINKSGKNLFAASHVDFPEEMLAVYWRQKFTPQAALKAIVANAGI